MKRDIQPPELQVLAYLVRIHTLKSLIQETIEISYLLKKHIKVNCTEAALQKYCNFERQQFLRKIFKIKDKLLKLKSFKGNLLYKDNTKPFKSIPHLLLNWDVLLKLLRI